MGELLHFQQQIEAMKSRCREWYEQLMERVKEMEQIYQDKIQSQSTNNNNNNQPTNNIEIDELSREIARLNEELEKFKGKYFDSEQQKLELADQLDEIKEEKFKMEEKMEELAEKLSNKEEEINNLQTMQQQQQQFHLQRNNLLNNKKSEDEWNEL